MNLNRLFLIALTAICLTACVSESDSNQSLVSSPVASAETSVESVSNPAVTEAQEEVAPIVIAPVTAPQPETEPEASTPSSPATTEPEATEPEREETPAAQIEVSPWLRIPMHYEVLLGRSQVWGEVEGTLSLNLAKAALSGSSTLEFNSTSSLLPLQLISYYGSDGEYYSAQIQSIDNKVVLLTTPLKQNVPAGPNAWNFYDNGSHPNASGYHVIADYAVRFLGKDKLNEGVHVLLGDSWFDEGVILDRLKTHLPSASIINKGVGGNTSTDLLARFDADVLPHNPSFVWIMSGTNDYWQDVSVETYKSNIDTLISKIIAINAVPVIFDSSVGPLNFGTDAITDLSHAYVTAIDELAAEN